MLHEIKLDTIFGEFATTGRMAVLAIDRGGTRVQHDYLL